MPHILTKYFVMLAWLPAATLENLTRLSARFGNNICKTYSESPLELLWVDQWPYYFFEMRPRKEVKVHDPLNKKQRYSKPH